LLQVVGYHFIVVPPSRSQLCLAGSNSQRGRRLIASPLTGSTKVEASIFKIHNEFPVVSEQTIDEVNKNSFGFPHSLAS